MTTFTLTGQLIAEQPLATASKDLIDREGKDKQPTPIPTLQTATGRAMYFPSTGLRGKLRRCAVEVIRTAVIANTGNSKPFTLDQHYLLTLGGVKGKGEQEKVSVTEEAEWLTKNPVLAVFGAGDAGFLGFVRGRLSVGNAFCQAGLDPAIFSGARTDEFTRDRAQAGYLTDGDQEMLVSRSIGNRQRSLLEAEIKTAEGDLRKARKLNDVDTAALLEQRIDALRIQVEKVKSDSGAEDVSVGMPLAGFKAIPLGARMEHRMALNNATQRDLGLLLATLHQFGLNPIVGGHVSLGCGLVSGEWEVREITGSGSVSLGTVKVTPGEGAEIIGELLNVALQDFKAFLQSKEADFSVPSRPAKGKVKDAVEVE